MKKIISIMMIAVAVMISVSSVEAKTSSKKKSSTQKRSNVRKSAVVTGDFDGDGKQDRIWTEGRYDRDGYAIGNIKLCSDNPKLGGKTWSGLMGVELKNLGRPGGVSSDLLGVIPYAMSTWCEFDTYVFRGGRWKEAIEPFTVWLGDEDSPMGVVGAPSGRKGYVGVYYNDMDLDNDAFERKFKEVKLKY